MVALPVLDSFGIEAPSDLRPLLVGDADGCMGAGSVGLVEGKARAAQVGHHRVAFLGNNPCSQDPLVEPCRLGRTLRLDGDVVDSGHGCSLPARGRFYYCLMADDWRLAVAPTEEADPPGVLSMVLEHELEEEALERLGKRLAVEVSAGDAAVFFYGESEEQVREADRLIRGILEEQGIEARLEISRWHPLEERWEDPSVPLPRTEAERRMELERLEAEEAAESRREGPLWEVRLELPGRRETSELAERLEAEGIPVLRRWKFLLVGAETERQANELADRLRQEVPEGTIVTVEGSGELLDEVAFPNPFVVFGGLGT